MPEISIIVPVYKSVLYICRCIESILNQTFSDFEVILVDDGSPDQCPAICDEYAFNDCRIHVLHQDNGGPSKARNKGIDWTFVHSNSKYITFVDSDDYLHPQFLEYMYYAIKKTKTRVSMCKHEYIMADGKIKEIQTNNTCFIKEISAEELMIAESSGFNYIWGKLYAKHCFQNIRFPEDVSFGEDNLIIFRILFECNKIVLIENYLYYYFYTPTGITKSPWSPKSLDVFKGIRAQLEFYAKHSYMKAYKKEIELYIQQCAYQIHRIREDVANYKKNKRYLSQMIMEMKAIIKKTEYFKSSDSLYWYEALHPIRAKVFRRVGKIKRNLKENGLRGTLKKIGKKFSLEFRSNK